MKTIKIFSILVATLGVMPGLTVTTYAIENEAVSMKASKNGKNIQIEINIKKGYGIQKKGPHELALFSLKKSFIQKGITSKSFETEGKQVYEAKPLKFEGKTSKEDDEYFSNVNIINVPVSGENKTGVRARIFFCSFKDSFCSVQTLSSVVE